jgi:uncharacterized protein YndB with AHSA1/START domain
MAQKPPLNYVFYIASTPEKVWEGFVSPESNRTNFMGAEFQADIKPGGSMKWFGPGRDGKPTTYVHGKILKVESRKLLQYTFAMGQSDKMSRVTLELTPESEAAKVNVTHDEWADDDSTYSATADEWPRVLFASQDAD